MYLNMFSQKQIRCVQITVRNLKLPMMRLQDYEGIFGYDPNGEIELEFNEQDEYLAVLLQCIEEKKDMFNVLRE